MVGVGLSDTIGECDAFDDAWQLVRAVELAPLLRCGPDQGEDHQFGGLLRQCALGADGAVPDGGEDALDRVRGAQMLPMLGREYLLSVFMNLSLFAI